MIGETKIFLPSTICMSDFCCGRMGLVADSVSKSMLVATRQPYAAVGQDVKATPDRQRGRLNRTALLSIRTFAHSNTDWIHTRRPTYPTCTFLQEQRRSTSSRHSKQMHLGNAIPLLKVNGYKRARNGDDLFFCQVLTVKTRESYNGIEFVECTHGKLVTVLWSCRAQHKAMNKCLMQLYVVTYSFLFNMFSANVNE